MADFKELVGLAAERLGGSVLYATDDFFAPKENLLKAEAPVWKEHEYAEGGRWMAGGESRRKRVPGHDYAIIRLGTPGVLTGVVVDTSFCRGNFPSQCSIEASFAAFETAPDALTDWIEVLPKSELKGDSQNPFPIENPHAFTHLRLHIYPDGGVARIRVHGEVVPEWHRQGGLQEELDLAAVEHGGQVLTCSDMFFGPKNNLIMPGPSRGMSDGWETRRRRAPGNDWVIVQLAVEATVRRIEVDTSFFKGNYPDTCSIDGDEKEILPRTNLLPEARHIFIEELIAAGPVKNIRLNVYPDGGVARLRVYGVASENARWTAVARPMNTRVRSIAEEELRSCGGSREWVRQMMASRPFAGGSELLAAAENIWWEVDSPDWQEAFAAHPRIGEKPSSSWAREEQAGASSAARDTMAARAQVNSDYQKRFSPILIVCPPAKSPAQIPRMAQR